jgi:hypothetical protein
MDDLSGGLRKSKKPDPYSMNPELQRFKRQAGKRLGDTVTSVADPGCLSRIWIFSIPDPGPERHRNQDLNPPQLSIFNPNFVTKITEI